MNYWRRLGIAGLAAGVLSFGAAQAEAACIDPLTHTVSNAAQCLYGDGGDTNCRAAVSLDFDGAGAPPADPKKAACTDGDPLCDADGAVNGSCTFRFGACVNI